MKHISFVKRNLLLALGAFALLATSCIKEDLDACKNFKLTLKVENGKGDDITALNEMRDATLYIFDEEGKFLESRKLDKNFITTRQEIELKNYESGRKLQMIAWGNLGDLKKQDITSPKSLEDLTLSLKSTNGVAISPDSLFYGSKSVLTMDGGVSTTDTIAVRMKTGIVTVKTDGYAAWAQKYLRSSDQIDFSVNNTLDSYKYDGTQTGDSVRYEPAGTQTEDLAEWQSEGIVTRPDAGGLQNMFAGQGLGCSIVVNGQALKTVYTGMMDDEDGNRVETPLYVPEGGRTDIIIEFAANGTISARIRVSPWGIVDDNIEF